MIIKSADIFITRVNFADLRIVITALIQIPNRISVRIIISAVKILQIILFVEMKFFSANLHSIKRNVWMIIKSAENLIFRVNFAELIIVLTAKIQIPNRICVRILLISSVKILHIIIFVEMNKIIIAKIHSVKSNARIIKSADIFIIRINFADSRIITALI